MSSRPYVLRVCQMLKTKTYASFDDLPEGYVRLFEEGAAQSFFYSLAWFRNFVVNALDEGDEVRIYGVELNGATSTPVAALGTRFQSRGRSRLQPMKLVGLSNCYSSLFGPVMDSSTDHGSETIQELVRAISSDHPRWDIVEFKPLDLESPVFTKLVRFFREAGMAVQTYFHSGNWYFPVNGRSYEEYLGILRSSVRNIAKSKNKRLEKSGRARFEIITGKERIESAIRAYERVYAASWKVPEPYPRFMEGLIRTCAEKGWLRLGLVYVDDEPAAAQVWIVNGGTASIYKMAYDQRFSHLSVGTFLTTRLLEHVIDVDKVSGVDYLSGDDPYKKNWMSHRRERWGIIAFNPQTWMGTLATARHVCGRAVKTALTDVLGSPMRLAMNLKRVRG